METTEVKEDANKVKKQFDATIHKLVAIIGDDKKLISTGKVPKDNLATVIADLFKEETEASEKALKEEVKTLLKGYSEFTKAVKAKEQELEQLKKQKMKEFTEAAKKVFGKIENLDQVERGYYEALGKAGKVVLQEEETDEDEVKA